MSEDPTPYYSGPQKPRKPAKKRKARAAASVRYGPGRYAPAANGRGFDCSVCVGGVRSRARMPDEPSARAWIDATEAGCAADLPPFSRAQLMDARQALSLLPSGVTLSEACRAFADARAAASSPSDPLSVCLAAFLADRAETNARPVTLSLYRQTVNRFIRRFGDIPASDLTRDRVAAMVAGLSAQSRNGILRNIGAFLEWCRKTGRIKENPAASVSKARTPEPPKGIVTPRQVEALLAAAAARRPALVPYLALAFFAGLRPEELQRLSPEKIGARYILLDGSVTKTSDTRSVEIRPNLAVWLAAYPPRPGRPVPPLSKKHLYAEIRAVRSDTLKLAHEKQDPALAVHAWPADCARHCFATYMYELTRDAAATAAEMGHKGIQVFFTHYRALASPGDGLLFSQITPESVSDLRQVCQRLLQPVAPQ